MTLHPDPLADPRARPLCRHCKERPAECRDTGRTKKLGLCRRCHADPEIRAKYQHQPLPEDGLCLVPRCGRPGAYRLGLCRRCYSDWRLRRVFGKSRQGAQNDDSEKRRKPRAASQEPSRSPHADRFTHLIDLLKKADLPPAAPIVGPCRKYDGEYGAARKNRISVFMQRRRAKKRLFHPHDCWNVRLASREELHDALTFLSP